MNADNQISPPVADQKSSTNALMRYCEVVTACPHTIDPNQVVLHYDPRQPGHNALAQLKNRLAGVVRPSAPLPAGWKYAPVRPVPTMIDAGGAVNNIGNDFSHHIWSVMMRLSPPLPVEAFDEKPSALEWAVERWRAEVSPLSLSDFERHTLDNVWRQVIQYAGGNEVALVGPAHDDLLAAQEERANGFFEPDTIEESDANNHPSP